MDGHSANILAKNPVERWVNDLRKRAPTKRGAGRKSLLEELLYVSTCVLTVFENHRKSLI